MKKRCLWVKDDPLYINYHDCEWGVPIYDERLLFEFLILEGMQAGLNWFTILKKREQFRLCFDNFLPEIVARYDEKKQQTLMSNPNIIRNRLKIQAAITNAQAFLAIKEEYGNFSTYLWAFVEGKPIKNHWKSAHCVPTTSVLSDILSRDLKKRGFKFVGSTIMYAFMQAVGMVNDHTVDCFRYQELHD